MRDHKMFRTYSNILKCINPLDAGKQSFFNAACISGNSSLNFGSGQIVQDRFSKLHWFTGSGQIYTSPKEAVYIITAASNVSLYTYQEKKLELYESCLCVHQAKTGDKYHAKYRGKKIFVHPKFTG